LDSECRIGSCLLGQPLPSRNKTFKTKNPRESASLPRPASGPAPHSRRGSCRVLTP
jgi:hypothetical protein